MLNAHDHPKFTSILAAVTHSLAHLQVTDDAIWDCLLTQIVHCKTLDVKQIWQMTQGVKTAQENGVEVEDSVILHLYKLFNDYQALEIECSKELAESVKYREMLLIMFAKFR